MSSDKAGGAEKLPSNGSSPDDEAPVDIPDEVQLTRRILFKMDTRCVASSDDNTMPANQTI